MIRMPIPYLLLFVFALVLAAPALGEDPPPPPVAELSAEQRWQSMSAKR